MNLIDVHTHFFPDEMKINRMKYCKIDANFNQLYANEDAQICTEDDLEMLLNNNSKLKLVIQSIGYIDYELTKYTNDFLIDLSKMSANAHIIILSFLMYNCFVCMGR